MKAAQSHLLEAVFCELEMGSAQSRLSAVVVVTAEAEAGL